MVTVESVYYDPEEELKVDWRDLGIPWPPKFSTRRDFPEHARSLKDLEIEIEPWRAGWLDL